MIGGVLKNWADYRCQVLGVHKGKDKPFLYLNFAHEESFRFHADEEPVGAIPPDWTKEALVVDDGGDWYWQVRYEPKTGTYMRMDINGEA